MQTIKEGKNSEKEEEKKCDLFKYLTSWKKASKTYSVQYLNPVLMNIVQFFFFLIDYVFNSRAKCRY